VEGAYRTLRGELERTSEEERKNAKNSIYSEV
jgi:hypothetical protein